MRLPCRRREPSPRTLSCQGRGGRLRAAAAGLLLATATLAQADELLLPSMLLQIGDAGTSSFAIDTRLSLLYTGESSATVDLYLIDRSTELPLTSATFTEVCNPCSFSLDGATPQLTLTLDSLLLDAGGFPAMVRNVFARVVSAGDTGSLAIQAELLNSHESSSEIEAHEVPLLPIGAGGGVATATTFPLLAVTPGSLISAAGNADARIDLYYIGPSSASVELFVIEPDGSLLVPVAGQCNPCTIELTPLDRAQSLVLDNLLPNDGIERQLRVDVRSSGDVANLALAAFVVRNLGSAFEVGLQYFVPVEVQQNFAHRFIFRDGFEGAWIAAAGLPGMRRRQKSGRRSRTATRAALPRFIRQAPRGSGLRLTPPAGTGARR